ncbi:MAG: HAD family hydrolase [Halanaerobiaceae bacterium]
MEWLKDIKVVILDLDGTLYIDTDFYKRYILYLIEGTKWENDIESIFLNMDMLFKGKHSFKIGQFYENEKYELKNIDDIFKFRGISDNTINVAEILSSQNKNYLYGGDAWSIVNIISSRMGISNQKRFESFVQVRKEMIEGEYAINRHKGMIDALAALSRCEKKYLMTNTPEESAVGFVKYLDIEDYFDEIHYGSNKPEGLVKVLNRLVEEGIDPQTILSIGDHVWNDLYPVQKIGGKTILVSPYEVKGRVIWDYYISDLDMLEDLLIKLENYEEE